MKYIVTFFLLLLLTWHSSANVIRVCPQCEIKSIREAIKVASPFDTIRISQGIYKEGTVIVDKPLFLSGEGWPVMDGEEKNEILRIFSDSVVVEKIVFKNVGISYLHDNAAISLESVKYCRVSNNRLERAFFGIYAKHSSNCEITDNQIIGDAKVEMSSGNAIHLWYCQRMTVEKNVAMKHRDGIYLEFVDDSKIRDNISENNIRYGLHFMFSNRDTYQNNTFRKNGAGVAVMFSRDIEMISNRFENNWGTASYGLLLKEIYDGKIERNIFQRNTIGIYGEGANRLLISQNLFRENGWALKVLGSCMDNTVTKNNFMANTFDLSTNSSRNYNNYDENYWSDYNGYDLNKDGYGDVPFRPMKLFSYMVTTVEPSIVLLRSFFIDIINFAEKVTPMFTPASLIDNKPLMQPWKI